jgi:hypothetical protein
VAFSLPKLLKIIPKAVRTRTNKGSLIGQMIFSYHLTFFISYICPETSLDIMKKLLYIFLFVPFTFLGQNTYVEQDIPLSLPEGWSMFGYTCLEPLDLSLGFESVVDKVTIVKDFVGSAYLPEWNFNGIGDLIYSRGYQIKTTEEITDFSFCPTLIGTEVVSNPQHQVGDIVEGGIVFYVDETGQHGLVAAQEDLEGTYEWGCYQEDVDGADSQWIGSGLQNTMDITNQGCATQNGGITAAQAALDAEINVYSDWYLPSQGELYLMYITIGQGSENGNIGDFQNNYYWSSSEFNSNAAWFVYFYNGFSNSNFKDYTFRVRIIRAF